MRASERDSKFCKALISSILRQVPSPEKSEHDYAESPFRGAKPKSADYRFREVNEKRRAVSLGMVCVVWHQIAGTEACFALRQSSFHLIFYSTTIPRRLSALNAQPTPQWGSPPSSVDQNQPPDSQSDRHHAARPHRAMIIISRSLIVIMARQGQALPWPRFSIRSVWL